MKQFKLKAMASAASALAMVAWSAQVQAQDAVPIRKDEAENAKAAEDVATPAEPAAAAESAAPAEPAASAETAAPAEPAVSAAPEEPAASADAGAAEEIIVTGRRKAIQAASDIKKNSDTMVDSVVADEAGKLPDNSITEVLQRIPGITMSRWNSSGDSFNVEGTGIQVRGLSNPSSMLNGREIFGANGGSALSWGEVTPELMAGVDVYKAGRANMLEGGTGGAIDLRTKMPFDYQEPAVQGALGLSYGDLVGKADPTGSVLGTTRFDTPIGEMGVLVDVAYSKLQSKSGHLSVEPYFKKDYDGKQVYVPGGFGWGDDNFQRERTGLYEAFQWRPSDNLTIFQTAFASRYKSENNGTSAYVANDHAMPIDGSTTKFDKNGVLVAASSMGYGSPGDGNAGSTVGQSWIPEDQQVNCNTPYATQAYSLNWSSSPYPTCSSQTLSAGSSRGFSTTDNLTSDFSEGFTWHANDRTRVSGALQYVYSTSKSTGLSAGLSVPVGNYSMDITGDKPKFLIQDTAALNDPGSYAWSNMSWRPTDNKGTMLAPNLDIVFDVQGDFFKSVGAGVRYASRKETDTYDGTYWEPFGNSWDGWEAGQQYLGDPHPAEDGEYYGFDHFFHGNVAVPSSFYVPSEALLRSGDYTYLMNTYGYNVGKTLPNGQHPTTPYESLHNDYGTSATNVVTKSVYLQADFGQDEGFFGVPYTGNIGVRYVRTETEATGNFVFNSTSFYLTQEDADADYEADPEGKLTPRAVSVPADIQAMAADSSDDRFLPMFNINFKLTDKMYIRLAANQTMSRPSFGDITVAGSGSVATQDNENNHTETDPTSGQPVEKKYLGVFTGVNASYGNTTLKPTISTNFDAAFEWYGEGGTAAHLSLFTKSLDDLIIFGDSHVPFPYSFTKEDGTVATGTDVLTTTQASNATKTATIRGFEFGARTFFDKLPGFWSGFGIDANFTFIDSKNPSPKSYDMDGNQFSDLPVTGMSRYSYNIQFMYQKGPFYAGFAYNWRSRSLMSTNANGTGTTTSTYNYYKEDGTSEQIHYALPLYAKAYGQLDFGTNYQITKAFKVYLQANNLTNATSISEMEILPGKFYPRNYYEADRRVDAGVNFSF
ncbi:TonB-dependent receptor [Hydrocarboniphaga sp.]|uniref:TonB-dependent receptor n=1 Tax=Hydrocarboniphaga sp. TaxID=2033016 RepID=UPI003D0B04D6